MFLLLNDAIAYCLWFLTNSLQSEVLMVYLFACPNLNSKKTVKNEDKELIELMVLRRELHK